MTRVAVIGNMQHTFCTEQLFATAFAENGCEVIRLQVDDVARDPDTAMSVLRACDAVTYTRTHAPTRFLDRSWTDRWQQLERAGVHTIGLHLDRFFDLERESLIHDGDAQFTCGTVWTADGGNQERFAKAGVNHRYLIPAIDRAQAEHVATPNPRLEYDVIFVGSGSPYHEDAYPQRGELLRHLHATYGSRFAHWGHGGGRPVVREHALSEIYRSAKVVVGDSCFANNPPDRRVSDYFSDRIPETLGRAGFLIHPWVPGITHQYSTGIHYVTHVPGDWEDLDAQIGAYIGNRGERRGIAQTGQQHTLAYHTWTIRMGEILATYDLTPAISGNRIGVTP